jgi:acetyl-CoA carboxylase biotin carboxylase subunit
MRRTLEMSVVEGIKTTIPLHLRIIAEQDFVSGRLGTGFMDRFAVKPSSPGSLAETA